MEVCPVLPWVLPRVNSTGMGRQEHITRLHSAAPGWGPGARAGVPESLDPVRSRLEILHLFFFVRWGLVGRAGEREGNYINGNPIFFLK